MRWIWLAILVLAPGCATLINGTTQNILVTSEPDGAKVKASNGGEFTTPATIKLSRKTDHALTVSKEGFASQQIAITHVISGAVAGNILAGGLIGWGVDASSGAQYKLIPDNVFVKLAPSGVTPDSTVSKQ